MFLGIDGGGSKTTAVLFRADGTFVDKAVVGSINYYSNPLSATQDNLRAIVQAFRKYTDHFDAVCIGMSALNDRANKAETETFTDRILCAEHILMDSDLFIALEAMHTDNPCAVAICGTGSMAVLRDTKGAVTHRGGFGYLLGDEGSGYAISLEAIRTAIRAAEGIVPPTALTEAALRYFEVSDVYGLIEKFYNPPMPRQAVAAFLPQVQRCAEAGDETAQRVLRTQAEAFAATVLALVKEDLPVGLWGGVFCHVPQFTQTFCDVLQKAGRTQVHLLDFPPEIGAVFAAWKMCGIVPDAARLARIRETYGVKEE